MERTDAVEGLRIFIERRPGRSRGVEIRSARGREAQHGEWNCWAAFAPNDGQSSGPSSTKRTGHFKHWPRAACEAWPELDAVLLDSAERRVPPPPLLPAGIGARPLTAQLPAPSKQP
jgi:hypothetical protein